MIAIVLAVPVKFLGDEQAAAGTSSRCRCGGSLRRFFYLDDTDRDLIALRRTTSHLLGFALQLTTVG
ncbi:DUF4158 domain-containing protein [Nonomuraea sp. bgisy101]|uniref:DUF4158 domain-containing protein n=1 Tax=Nonomuraea sp. bgisy101 TaxID=3413784 RepID=UPI003D7444FA